MNQSLTIPNSPPEELSMDFDFLRKEGIKYIQEFAGKLWTDYNLHDPGISILEQLCYAITDLGYRINYDIKDLLARKEGGALDEFFSPRQILTTNPVSLNDYRKIMLDVEGVHNAWISKELKPLPESYYTQAVQKAVIRYKNPKNNKVGSRTTVVKDTHGLFSLSSSEELKLKGLYKVQLDVDGNATGVRRMVEERLMATRNLCEDFAEISVLEPQKIRVNLTIEINETEDLGLLVRQVFEEVDRYISPGFRFHTLQEMLAKGKSIDEIFDGPVLKRGFVDDDELNRNLKKENLYVSDIINEVMNVEGVETVSNISLQAEGGQVEFWSLALDESKVAKLDVENSVVKLSRNGIDFSVDSNSMGALRTDEYKELDVGQRDLIVEETAYRDLADYYSVQNDFPDNFGLAKESLLESDLPEHKAKAKQLKAYLMFFEQVLANYFSQLEHFKDFYSPSNTGSQSYYSQSLRAVPEVEKMLFSFSGYEQKLEGFSEDAPIATERRNRALNHLLARFSEDFTDYALMLYRHGTDREKLGEDLIRLKSGFLKEYPEISGNRGKAFDYSRDDGSVSGLEKRISRMLDIDEKADKRFFIVEHILLRPVEGDYFQKYGDGSDTQFFTDLKKKNDFSELNQVMTGAVRKDPYSLQLTFVFPDWEPRSQSSAHRAYIEKVVRQETPAHLVVYVQWLAEKPFMEFRATYNNWVAKLQGRGLA